MFVCFFKYGHYYFSKPVIDSMETEYHSEMYSKQNQQFGINLMSSLVLCLQIYIKKCTKSHTSAIVKSEMVTFCDSVCTFYDHRSI